MSERSKVDADEMRKRQILADRVGSGLSRDEQETAISALGAESRFQITTFKPSIVRKLLRHSYAEIEWCYVYSPDGANKRIDSIDEVVEETDQSDIEGLRAYLPIGALTIKGSPRKSDKPSKIVTTPEDVEAVREVFGDE